MTHRRATTGPVGPVGPALDLTVLAAHLASGALWIIGLLLASPDLGGILVVGLAAYAVLGSLALASRASRNGLVLILWWVIAVVLVTALVGPGAGLLAPVIGAVVGSVVFGAWSLTGALLTQFLDGRDAVDPTRLDTR